LIAYIDISGLQHVDGPGVLASDAAVFPTLLLDDLLYVRPAWQPLRRERAAHQHLVRMNGKPAVLVFMVEPGGPQLGPRLLECDRFHAADMTCDLAECLSE
jgi:hypothetical protein